MDKCQILKEEHEWTEKIIKTNPYILSNLKTSSKQAASLIKNIGIEKYLSLDKIYSKVLRESELEAFKFIIDEVKAKIKEKYTKDDILLFLGYCSRELTFYDKSEYQNESTKKLKRESQQRATKEKNYKNDRSTSNSLTSKPFEGLQNLMDKKEKK
jgi:hypothetical protein